MNEHDDEHGDDNDFARAVMGRASTALSGRARAWLNMRDEILIRVATARALAAPHSSQISATDANIGADMRFAEKIATRVYPGGERLNSVYDERVGSILKDIKHIVESHAAECENTETCMVDEEGKLLLADFEAIFGPKKAVQ